MIIKEKHKITFIIYKAIMFAVQDFRANQTMDDVKYYIDPADFIDVPFIHGESTIFFGQWDSIHQPYTEIYHYSVNVNPYTVLE